MVEVMVLGCHGRLGSQLVRQVTGKYDVIGVARDEHPLIPHIGYEYLQVDMLDRQALKDVIYNYHPAFVINTAAMSDVNMCETHKELCWKINVEAVQSITEACKKTGTFLIHVSTDYVFDGAKGNYAESDRPQPVKKNYYGKSKLASENAVRLADGDYAIVRTSTLIGGDDIKQKGNLGLWLYRQFIQDKSVILAVDAIRNPTLFRHLAQGIWKIVKLEKSGLFHIAGAEPVSIYEFGQRLAQTIGSRTDIIQEGFVNMKGPALRPKNSSLAVEKAIIELDLRLPVLGETLKEFNREVIEVLP